jgi:hypothetical protein
MVTTASNEWAADLVTMTCKNTTNNIVVVFEKNERILIGKIKSIPLELVKKWTEEKKEDTNINNALIEAEIIFLKEYYASD